MPFAFDRFPLRAKVLSGALAVALLITLFTFYYYPHRQRQSTVAAMQRRALGTAEMVALGVGIGLELDDFAAVTAALNWAKRDSALVYVVVADTALTAFASYNPTAAPVDIARAVSRPGVHEAGGFLQSVVPVEFHGARHGWLLVGMSLKPMRDQIRRDRLTALAVSAAVLALGALLSLAFANRIARPVVELQHAAEQVARGEYDVAMPVTAADEVGALAAAFGEMTRSLRTSFEALRRSEAAYRGLVEHAPYGICSCSAEGRIRDANPALAGMLGYASAGELQAADLARDVFLVPEDFAVLVERFRLGETVEGVERPWKRRDGSPLTVRLGGRAVKDEHGTPVSVELIAEDVTVRHALEEQLRQAQKMEAVGQLTGGIAHDLNNTLTVIQANADLLSPVIRSAGTDAHADLLELQAATQRGAEMIRKLLAFGRREMLTLRPVALEILVRDLVKTLRRLLPATIVIEVAADEDLPAIEADGGAIEQVLVNLATNARDAMPEGGTLRIELRRRTVESSTLAVHGIGQPGEFLCVTVSDTGIGMDERTRARLFEPFFTTKPQGEGSGLGSAMVYGLVRQHGGFVSVYSEPGRGTSMQVYLPVSEKPATRRPPPGPTALTGGRETILLAEDEEPVRRAGKRVLERFGYTVLAARDGAEALEIFEAHEAEIRLIVSDLVMPRMGGRELLEVLRRRSKRVKVLLSSGYSARDVTEATDLDPNVPFLHKPWTLSELVTGVRAVLDAGPGG